jgi:hypothetical protein
VGTLRTNGGGNSLDEVDSDEDTQNQERMIYRAYKATIADPERRDEPPPYVCRLFGLCHHPSSLQDFDQMCQPEGEPPQLDFCQMMICQSRSSAGAGRYQPAEDSGEWQGAYIQCQCHSPTSRTSVFSRTTSGGRTAERHSIFASLLDPQLQWTARSGVCCHVRTKKLYLTTGLIFCANSRRRISSSILETDFKIEPDDL